MPTVEHIDAIERLSPKTLIDVGANKGQFSLLARYLFPEIEIHAFEPLESERVLYQSVLSEPVKIYSMALGATAGEATFFVASRADSSSLLQPGTAQQAAYGVTTMRSITVPVARLKDVLDISILPRPILLKLDVQGGELEVLKGAENLLLLVDTVYCETSFVQLYENQPLANEIASYLIERGFALSGVFNQSVTRKFGATQADFLWQKTKDCLPRT
jgi:FkbM family methyltransferase